MKTDNHSPRETITSKIEVWPDDPNECQWNNEPKCTGIIIINTKARTISFTCLSGRSPTLYVVLLLMQANKHWHKILENAAQDNDDSQYFILTKSNIDNTTYFLAHNSENDLPVIDKKLIGFEGVGGKITECTFNATEYSLLAEEVPVWPLNLKDLRKYYGLKFIK